MRIRKKLFWLHLLSNFFLYLSISLYQYLFSSLCLLFVQTEISQKRSLSVTPFLSFFHCLFVSVCLSIYIYLHQPISISVSISIYLSNLSIYVSIYQSINQSIYLSIYISIHLCMNACMYLSQ